MKNVLMTEECAVIDTYTYVKPSGKLVSDQGSQTIYSKYELSAKVETMILKNDVSTTQFQGPKIVSTLSHENMVQDVALMKHFTGLRSSQFEVLHDFLDDVCPVETINYRKSKDCPHGGGTPLQEPNGDVPLDGVAFSQLE